jgi:hypothetical protein
VKQIPGLTYEVVPSRSMGAVSLPAVFLGWPLLMAEAAVALAIMRALFPNSKQMVWKEYAAAVAIAVLIRQVERTVAR